MKTDQQIIAETNALARSLFAGNLPADMRCDTSRAFDVISAWRSACRTYHLENGIDPQQALARHEAETRKNNVVLSVDHLDDQGCPVYRPRN